MTAAPGRARASVIVAIAVAVAAALGGCKSRPPLEPPPLVAGPGRFPHEAHGELGCPACHDVAAVQAGTARMPGSDQHAPCDRGQCHADAFAREPGPVCRICHAAVDPTGAGRSPLRPFPADDQVRNLPSRFSHARHLDDDAMERAVGFHVACADCHLDGASEVPTASGHAPCARCHADEIGLAGAPAMTECTRCHEPTAAARFPRKLITGDLRFAHELHLIDARGERIRCETCHAGTDQAGSTARHPPPPTSACVACHDDATRVSPTKRMRICSTCHVGRQGSIGTLAPRSHLPATERPADHTLAFRRDHRAEAEDATRCATCHTMMSGRPRAACDECHQAMRPTDHTVLWREYDHGADAVVDRDRCATCHVVDYCTACHRRPPRSHLPRGAFAASDHGDLARQNPRACITCHQPETDCTGAGCHTMVNTR